MKIKLIYFFPVFLFVFGSCSDNREPERVSDINTEEIFLDYKIAGEEGYDKLTILARLRYGGKNGNGLLLEKPAKIELDGEAFPADSSAMSGTFYELYKPIQDFQGKHSIKFTDFSGKEHEHEFSFEPMQLLYELPETVKRSEMVIELSGVESGDLVRVLMTDTSFINDGIHKVDTLSGNKVIISADELNELADGPIHLELIKESERRFKNEEVAGGRMRVLYTLRRSFILEK